MQHQGKNLNAFLVNKQGMKGYILYVFIYMTFWRRQSYRNEEQNSDTPGWGEGRDLLQRAKGENLGE